MDTQDHSFTLTHEFNAPVEKVFDAWSIPDQLAKWLPPKGYSMVFAKSDITPGGMSHYCMVSKSGLELWSMIFYKDVIPPAKLSYTQVYSNEQGGIEPHPMIKNFPVEILSTVMLDEKNGKTILDLTWEPLNASKEEITRFSDETFELSQEWGGTFEQLTNYLATN
ncbi:MAG: hypothetical protein DHS20C09_19700 [marine bacterium B5-7]|nr:MAG: hypothetical protein DHS20C09_19700 [marine bacterium B5-7]